jgi:hypothetical protein
MKLEDLPNELLIEIFEYIDIRDLFNGFWNLNKRINDLLRMLRNLSYNLERLDLALISLFSKQITRLIVNTWQYADLYQFPYLHSLILYQATINQLQQIRVEFMPHLVYLSVSALPGFASLPQLAEQIFSNAMPSIRHVDLGHVHVPYLRTWSQSPSLSSVSIHSTNPTVIPYILQSSPNLVYLHVHFLMDTIAIFDDSPSISNHSLKQFILLDPYHKLSFNHIRTIFTMIPNVRKLQLNFLCKIPFIRFARSLINRLHNLKQFDCKIDDASFDQSTTIETIQQIHPCFQRIYCSTNDLHFRIFTTK